MNTQATSGIACSFYYGGMTQDDFNDKLPVSVFSQQAAPDIHKHFVKHTPVWQGGNLQMILSLAAHIYDGSQRQKRKKRNEERERK